MPGPCQLKPHPSRPGHVLILSPFEAKDTIRSLPSRQWDPTLRGWVIPSHHVSLAVAALVDAGFRVLDPVGLNDHPGGPRTGRTRPNSSGGAAGTSDPFAALYAALPDHLRAPTYRALVRVLHPDVGGDGRLTQILNDGPFGRAVA